MKPPGILALPPNRVRRNYLGGKLLDRLAGQPSPSDGSSPEDWIAATTVASNPGLPERPGEGLAHCRLPDGRLVPLQTLFDRFGPYYLGLPHCSRIGTKLGFLAKLLDAAMRLHVQAHPTAKFARQHLGSRWGKLETYVILAVRPGVEPYIRLGFQHPPDPGEWRRIVFEQDIAAMDACFEKIPVAPGEVWMVPGGLPHAIGEGLLVLEVMEPTDLVVRCEHEREGIIVPPAARYMGCEPDFALNIFDYTPLEPATVIRRFRMRPEPEILSAGCSRERLIGPQQTSAFREERLTVHSKTRLPLEACVSLWVVIGGEGQVNADGHRHFLTKGSKFLVAASVEALEVQPSERNGLQMVCCMPGVGDADQPGPKPCAERMQSVKTPSCALPPPCATD